jgi:hypothetical protein
VDIQGRSGHDPVGSPIWNRTCWFTGMYKGAQQKWFSLWIKFELLALRDVCSSGVRIPG